MRVLALLLMTAAPALAEGDLFIYSWGEYTPPDLVAKFEAEFGVKVHIDSYDSMETMIAKLRAGGAGYDIIVPGDATMQVLIAEGMVEKIDVFAMPNFANVDDRWREVYWDPKREYSAPWAWGSTAFAVDTAVVTGDTSSLAMLFDPAEEVKGRINMLRDMNDVINMAERYLGIPRCSENPDEMKRVLELLEAQKEWVKSYDSETKEILVSGEAVVSMSWNGYAMRARDEKPTITYVYPKEGYTGWMDNVAVAKGAPNMENAKAWVNFVMDPENAAMITNYARYSNGIKGSEAFIDPALAAAPEINPPADAPAPEFIPTCSPEATALIDKVWTKLMN